MHKRSLPELIDTKDPGWPRVEEWLKQATNHFEVLPVDESNRGPALLATQVTTRSAMGAIVYGSGGLLIDHCWLRIYGSGHPRLSRSLPDWNKTVGMDIAKGMPPFLIIADDVVGGFFALDGGALGKPGNVFYKSPDALDWEDMEGGYSDFFWWCLVGDLKSYYADFRWDNWEAEVAKLQGDQGIMFYPFFGTLGPSLSERHRSAVPMLELYRFYAGAQ